MKEIKILLNSVLILLLSVSLFAETIVITDTVSLPNDTYPDTTYTEQRGTTGGAVYVNGGKVTVEGITFSSNTATFGGGAIALDRLYGSVTISSETIFSNNGTTTNGGAINNNAGILKISGDNITFKSNYSSNGNGGAIFNNWGKAAIGDGVSFVSNTATNGGAIFSKFNEDDGSLGIGNNVEFIKNSAGTNGGAIYNYTEDKVTATIGDNVVFSSNSAILGGAIYNQANKLKAELTIGKNVTFSYNYASTNGGAIYNNKGTLTIADGATFIHNRNTAIYNNSGILNLTADTIPITFTDNVTAVYDNAGTINLYAKDSSIIFNDSISSQNNSSVLNINQNLSSAGTVEFNTGMRGYKGTVNFYGGEIKFGAVTDEGSNINNSKFFNGNINLSSGTVDFSNNAIDNINVNSLITTINTNLKFDVDLSNNTSDNWSVTNAISDTNELNLTKINILGVNETTGSITLFNNGNSPVLNIISATVNYGNQEYTFTNNETIAGVIDYELTGIKTFKEVVNDIESEIRNYSFENDEIVTEDLESLGGTELSIYGNGYNIFASSVAGITVSENQILNIEGLKEVTGFTSENNGGFLYNNGGTINLTSHQIDMEFSSNTANGISNAIHDNGGTMNLWASGTADIILNDRITSEDDTSILNINSSKNTLTANGKIILNEDMTGYTGQVNLYKGTIELGEKGTLFNGDMLVDNATINMVNENIQEHNFNRLTVNNNLSLSLDVDLENKKMDTISANDDSEIDGTIKVKSINLLSDALETTNKILFTSSTVLKDKITVDIKTVNSKLYKYDIFYEDGYFEFIKIDNPAIFEQAVAASVGGYMTQNMVAEQSFACIDNNIIKKQKEFLGQSSNLYASAGNQVFEENNKIKKGLWLRPVALQETVKVNETEVDNNLIGTLAGIDLPVGQEKQVSFYIGYVGSNQKYGNEAEKDIKISQTGYVIGATGMLIKENFYLGVTANAIFNKVESERNNGTDNFDMNMYTLAAKTGYNFDVGNNWILEPNITMLCGMVNAESYKTTNDENIDSQNSNNIVIEPNIKAKWEIENGWQPYVLVGYVANMNDNVKVVSENKEFELDKIDGYLEYGAGVNKEFISSPWTIYAQLTGRNGGRKGFVGNFGVKYKF